jgi:hypothetical protein
VELPRILNAENYAELLLHNLEDLLDNVPLQHLPQWFQHDGAPAHFARNVRDILHHMYNCPFTLRLYWGRKSSYLLISCPFVWVSEATRPCNKSNFKSCWVDVQGPV